VNRGQLETAIRERCGLSATDAKFSDAVLDGYINRALHWIETRKPTGWSWMHVTDLYVPGGSEYEVTLTDLFSNVAQTVRAVTDIRIRDSADILSDSLTRWPRDDALSFYPNLTAQGAPEVWATVGATETDGSPGVLFRPTLSADFGDLQVYGLATELDLPADDDSPILPARFHDVIVERCAVTVFRRLHDGDQAKEANDEANDWITKMLRADRLYTGPGQSRYDRTRDAVV